MLSLGARHDVSAIETPPVCVEPEKAEGARRMLRESLRTSVQPAWARIERHFTIERPSPLVQPAPPSPSTAPNERTAGSASVAAAAAAAAAATEAAAGKIDDDDTAFWQRFRDQIHVAVMQLPTAKRHARTTDCQETREDEKPMDVNEFMLASKMVAPPRKPVVLFTPQTFAVFPDIANFSASATPTHATAEHSRMSATSHRKVCVCMHESSQTLCVRARETNSTYP